MHVVHVSQVQAEEVEKSQTSSALFPRDKRHLLVLVDRQVNIAE
jgi:hypothetical protein